MDATCATPNLCAQTEPILSIHVHLPEQEGDSLPALAGCVSATGSRERRRVVMGEASGSDDRDDGV